MDPWQILWQKLAEESPTIAAVLLFFGFWIWNAKNIVAPAGQSIMVFMNRVTDKIIEPFIPITEHAISFLSAQSAASEAQARSNQQTVDLVQDSIKLTRELFETRFADMKSEFGRQVGEMKSQMQKLGEENTVLKSENAQLKEELKTVKRENVSLKEEVERLKRALAGKQDKVTGTNAKGK